ncbi:hypothetical protein HYDPIDRAFT_90267 [Hydnomerulius pinastri MD-312]|uniref:Large ribosomal subunit protein uL29m n=1 Tax=Hydnomerulius pinastri MD-312 TaxID=994086 RepID=A0A0C9WF34_9AGAM|nr:hypothetical protein HYDPIDRAFT_90267 [Hydnomerulius pinastri MD-312]
MSSILQATRPFRALRALHRVRWNSNAAPGLEVSRTVEAPESGAAIETAPGTPGSKPFNNRPHLGIQVDLNHGLYSFFRKKEVNGVVKYETLEPVDDTVQSGEPWSAAELRRKSFKDLHTLWYVLLRERNLLASQKEEARRASIVPGALAFAPMDKMCRKSMARLKFVINERRLQYEKLFVEGEMSSEEILGTVDLPKKPMRSVTRKVRAERRRKALEGSLARGHA